ncbi:MAG: hypothetical protein QG604_685 [Candidatus Dependentiae bacterium]|nr:hypothetical protein [Candidatus Dependentiae bacterium]
MKTRLSGVFACIALTVYFGNTLHANATAGISLAAYESQQAALNAQLASLKHATATPPIQTGQKRVEEAIKQLPTQSSMQALSASDQADLKVFLGKITQKYGQEGEQIVRQSIMRNPDTTRASLALVKAQRRNLDRLVGNIDAVNLLISDPKKLLLTYKSSTEKPIVEQALKTMSKLKTYMSPTQWWSIMTEFVGKFFIKFWHNVWVLVKEAMIAVIGEEKIYEMNADGTIKTDSEGNKLPLLITQYSVGDNGEAVKRMIPNKWYNALDDEQSLLGQLVQSGINRSIESTFKSLDRIFFRPIASTALDVPLWKLSYVHYKLAMTQLKKKNTPLITPKALSDYILHEKDPSKLLTAGLPFSLQAILATKDTYERNAMLQTAITKHLWTLYEPLWKEIETQVKVGQDADRNNVYADFGSELGQGGKPGTVQKHKAVASAKAFGDKLFDEAKGIAKDSLMAKIQEGPLTRYLAYANLALNVPQTLFGLSFTEKPVTTLTDKDGKEIDAATRAKILKAIDICDGIARQARLDNRENLSDDTEKKKFTIILDHAAEDSPTVTGKTMYIVEIAPITLKKLMEKQESGLKRYLPFMKELAGESLESYYMKLLMPRLVFKLFPRAAKERLGINNLADAADAIDIIKRHYAITFKTLSAISSLMATIRQFEGVNSFAGHYTQIADKFHSLMISVSSLISTIHPIPKDPWEKRVAAFARYAKEKTIGRTSTTESETQEKKPWYKIKDQDAFTVGQLQKIIIAQEKCGYGVSPTLLISKDLIIKYLNATDEEAATFKAEHLAVTTMAVKQAAGLQNSVKKVADYKYNTNPITYWELTRLVRSWHYKLVTKQETGDINGLPDGAKSTTPRIRQVTNRAIEVAMHTFGLLALHRSSIHNEFFTGTDEKKIEKTDAKQAKSFSSFNKDISGNLARALSQFQELFYVVNRLYAEWGLREITTAFDEHYRATGEEIKDIPLKTFAKIAATEGLSHLVGYGADFLLKKALAPLMNKLSEMQDNNMFGGQLLNRMAQKQFDAIFGGTGGHSNAYNAAHDLMRNIFDYGAETALKNTPGALVTKFMPGGDAGTKKAADLALHAKMIAESKRGPNPIIAKKLKAFGMDPEQILAQGVAPTADEYDEDADDSMQSMSPAMEQMFSEAEAISRKDGPAAAQQYIREKIRTLSAEEQELVKKIGFGA